MTYLTVGQVAKEIGVSRQAVHYMINDGRLAARWMLEQWAIPKSEVTRLKRERNGKSATQSEQAA